MARIGHQFGAFQGVGKQLLAKRNRGILVGLVQAMGQKHMLRALDDEGGGGVVKLVDVGLKPTVLGLLKIKGEGVVQAVRAQPNEAIGAGDDVGLERLGVAGADAGVDAVAGNHQVGIGEVEVGLHIAVKHQIHTQLLAACLQDVEQFLATNANKTMAT